MSENKVLEFDTPEGRGFLDATLLKLGDAKPTDALVIKYGGDTARRWADMFRVQLCNAAMEINRKRPGSVAPIYVFIVPEDVTWEWIKLNVPEAPK